MTSPLHRTRDESGFTVVELAVTGLILGIVVALVLVPILGSQATRNEDDFPASILMLALVVLSSVFTPKSAEASLNRTQQAAAYLLIGAAVAATVAATVTLARFHATYADWVIGLLWLLTAMMVAFVQVLVLARSNRNAKSDGIGATAATDATPPSETSADRDA